MSIKCDRKIGITIIPRWLIDCSGLKHNNNPLYLGRYPGLNYTAFSAQKEKGRPQKTGFYRDSFDQRDFNAKHSGFESLEGFSFIIPYIRDLDNDCFVFIIPVLF
jgi:hypothetical protein